MQRFGWMLAFACLGASPVAAQELRIGEIKAQLWLERSGRLSDDVLALSKPNLANLPRGEGIFGEPANTAVVTIQFLGPRNTMPKFSSAIVNVITVNRAGQRRVEARPQLGFVFGETGAATRPIVLENVTCSRVEVEVKARAQARRVNLDFSCTDPDASEPPAAQRPARR